MENQQQTIVFPKGNVIPSVKALTFYRSGTFTVDVQYADVSELQAPSKISTYTVTIYLIYKQFEIYVHIFLTYYVDNVVQIGPFQATKGEKAKVKVKARLNLHGIVSVESAQVCVMIMEFLLLLFLCKS